MRTLNPRVEQRGRERGVDAPNHPQRSGTWRWLRRRRWHLAPVAVAVGAYAAAAAVRAWPVQGLVAIVCALVGVLAWVARADLRPEEKLYGRLVTAATAGWILLAALAGPARLGVLWLWVALLWSGGWPWWRHRRIRGRIRVEGLVEAWPDWTARAQQPGVRLVSATAGRVADVLRLELQRGRQRATDFIANLPHLASVRGIPEWWLRAERHPTDPGLVDLYVTHTDPWRDGSGRPIDLPHPAIDDPDAWCKPRSVCDPAPYGVADDGHTAEVRLRNAAGGRVVVVAAKKGAGKTVLLHDLMAAIAPMVDVDIAMIDLKEGGKASRPWALRLIRRATTLPDAIELLKWAAVENARRGAESPDPVLQPTPERRALVVVVDEYGSLALASSRIGDLVEDLGRTIRSASGVLIIADQRPDSTTWSGALRGQIDEVIVGRMENARDAKAILPGHKEVDVTSFAEELHGQVVQQAGKAGVLTLARSWYLEQPANIMAIVQRCPAPSPDEAADPVNASRSTPDLEDTLQLPAERGSDATAMRARISAALDDLAADQAAPRGPDWTADELRKIGEGAALPDPTAEEQTLDQRILDAIQATAPDGISMGDLVERVGQPRTTVQMRCTVMSRERPPRVQANPPRGRYARWHIAEGSDGE